MISTTAKHCQQSDIKCGNADSEQEQRNTAQVPREMSYSENPMQDFLEIVRFVTAKELSDIDSE